MIEYKLGLVGETDGNSKPFHFIFQFLNRFKNGSYDPTLDDTFEKIITDNNGETYKIIFLETFNAGLKSNKELYLKMCNGFICFYSITSRSSFNTMESLRDQILYVKDLERVPTILVGNDDSTLENQRIVSADEGKHLAESFNQGDGCPFFEISTNNRINIDESVFSLINEIRKTTSKGQYQPKKWVDHAGQVVQAIDLYQQVLQPKIPSSAPPSVAIQFPSFPSNLRLIGQVCSRKSSGRKRNVLYKLI
ncbi:hypothetical protein ACTA71_003929 [Dictyostelium dimigraforme]